MLSGMPQGSGLSPLFFVVFIEDLAKMLDAWIEEQEEKGEVVSKGVKKFKACCFYSMYADDLKLTGTVLDEDDMETVQEVLERVYQWAESSSMMFSKGKTKCLQIGREEMLGNYRGAQGEALEWEVTLKDLGVWVSSDGSMRETVGEVIKKVNTTSWWLARTFANRTPRFMLFLWKMYLMSQYEYCGPLWYPISYQETDSLEVGLRSWLRRIPGLQGLHHWDRIKELGVSSIQWRTERFFILTYYKLANGLMKGPDCYRTRVKRQGRVAVCPDIPRGVEPWVATLRRNGFHYRAALLYNSSPR